MEMDNVDRKKLIIRIVAVMAVITKIWDLT